MRAPRNLLLLTIDAWRADFTDRYAGVALTPNLGLRAAHTARFERVWANGPWTSPGLVPMFNGRSPARDGIITADWTPPAGVPSLAGTFAAAGHHVPNLCYLSQVGNYLNLGYPPHTALPYPKAPDDPVLFDGLSDAATRGAQPFFAWYHYKFVHLPYWPEAPYRRALGVDDTMLPARLRDSVCREFVVPRAQFPLEPTADADAVRRLYAAGVLRMDAWLGEVFAHLDRLGLTESTTIVVTADHGDELLERGHVGHASTAEHASLHEEVLRIPLFVIDSRIDGLRRRPERVQGLDLFPTLLALAGLDPPPGAAIDGVDVSTLALAPERFVAPPGFETRPFLFHSARMGYRTPPELHGHAQFGLSDGRHKVVVEHYENTRVALYDLIRDPGETAPASHGPEVDAAAVRLAAAFATPMA